MDYTEVEQKQITNNFMLKLLPRIIKLCIDLYTSSPKAYDTLKNHLILPSKRTVRYSTNTFLVRKLFTINP